MIAIVSISLGTSHTALAQIKGADTVNTIQYKTVSHQRLNELASDLVLAADAMEQYQEIGLFRDRLGAGGVSEDDWVFPPTCGNEDRFMQHFYQPASGLGLDVDFNGTGRCTDAVTWARNSAEDRTWSGAISSYDYTQAAKSEAYFRLGHVAHLIGDMSQPEHTHLEPHAAGGGGIEVWVADNHNLVLPDVVGGLTPKKLMDMESHLTEMSAVTYAISSFFGGELRRDEADPIDLDTRLAEMFNVSFNENILFDDVWEIRNYADVDPAQTALGSWDGASPIDDDWRETFSETLIGPRGFYYIEEMADAIPRVYWNANGVKVDNTTTRHNLVRIFATELLPMAREYIAGLYQFYHDIVNPPPYVSAVRVSQEAVTGYEKVWKDIEVDNRVTSRDLEALIEPMDFNVSSEIEVEIVFSEPVQDNVTVLVGDLEVSGDLDAEKRTWVGLFVPDGALDGEQVITISAVDQHVHYDQRAQHGGELDSDPSTPAKTENVSPYNWMGYESPGSDTNHIIRFSGGTQVAFVIDDTGSMSEEIGGVRNALLNYLASFPDTEENTVFQLTTFKDNVTKRASTTELALIESQVAALVALGGGDCPEASLQGLNAAAADLAENATVLLATDASPQLGQAALDDAIANLRGKGHRVNVILSGDCSSFSAKSGMAPFSNSDNKSFGAKSEASTIRSASATLSAIEAFSAISRETGGVFAFVPEVNSGETSEVQRFENTSFNILKGGVSEAIVLVEPFRGPVDGSFVVTITGANTNFRSNTVVDVEGGGITVSNVVAKSAIQLEVTLTIESDAVTGFRDLTATTDLGGVIEVARGVGAFQVVDAPSTPTILSISPPTGVIGEELTVQISGINTHFDDTSVLDLGAGITVQNLTVVTPVLLNADIKVEETTSIGYRDVSVTTGGEVAAESVIGPFFVAAEPSFLVPRLLSVSPAELQPGGSSTIEISGENTNFISGTSVLSFSEEGIDIVSVNVLSATTLSAVVNIQSDAEPGFRDVRVTTDDEVAVLLDGVLVTDSPELLSTLTVTSSRPDSQVVILVSPVDVHGESDGSTPFARTYNAETIALLTAQEEAPNGFVFDQWVIDDTSYVKDLSLEILVNENHTVTASYLPALPHDYLFLADNDIIASGLNASYGNIHANNRIAIGSGLPSQYTGQISALGPIRISASNHIEGDVAGARGVRIEPGATVSGTVTSSANVSSVDLPEVEHFATGEENVRVVSGEERVILPGEYHRISVQEGGTLILENGAYVMRTLDIGSNGAMYMSPSSDQVTSIYVRDDITLHDGVTVSVKEVDAYASYFVRIFSIQGNIAIGNNSIVHASLVSPAKTVSLGVNVLFNGAISARNIHLASGVLAYHHTEAYAKGDHTAGNVEGINVPVISKTNEQGTILYSNYPNPFNPFTKIRFTIPETQHVKLIVYDVLGREVATLVDEVIHKGTHEVDFDGTQLSSGIYIYNLSSAKNGMHSGHMLLMK